METFKSLFDGHTLDGWEGDLSYWSVSDGAIVGKSSGMTLNQFLCTTERFDDFELRVTFRIIGDDTKNSGIQFRSERVPDSTEMVGYQADIGQQYWGCLYDEGRREQILVSPPADELAKVLYKDGFNTYVIHCAGPHVTLTLNALTTADYVENDASVARSGLIGLQIHFGTPVEVQFRDVRIRSLKDSEN